MDRYGLPVIQLQPFHTHVRYFGQIPIGYHLSFHGVVDCLAAWTSHPESLFGIGIS